MDLKGSGRVNIALNIVILLVGLITSFLTFIVVISFLIYVIRRKPFPKKLLIAPAIAAGILGILVASSYLFYSFTAIDRNSTQPGSGPVLSPDGSYEATATYELYGGAVGGVNVWVDVWNIETEDVKTIYYADAVGQVELDWVDDTTIAIWNEDLGAPARNYNAKLNVETEIFHDRGRACWSLLLKPTYENCYSESMMSSSGE